MDCRLITNRNQKRCKILRQVRGISKKSLKWNHAKARYPRLSPRGDADKDGVKNSKDCRPFNKKKHIDDDRGGDPYGYYSDKDVVASSKLVKGMELIRYGREMGLSPRDTHNELKEKGYSGQEMRDALDLYRQSLEGKRIGIYG